MEGDFYLATPYYIGLNGTANAETPEHLSERLDRGPPKFQCLGVCESDFKDFLFFESSKDIV